MPSTATRAGAGAAEATSTAAAAATPVEPAPHPDSSVNGKRSAQSTRSYFSTPTLDVFVAGLCAGSVSTLVLHPFDLIKTRLQVVGFHSGAASGAGKGLSPQAHIYRHSLGVC